MTFDPVTKRVQNRNLEHLVFVCFKEVSFRGQDSNIGAVWRVGKGFRSKALVSAGLFHCGKDCGLEHSRGVFGRGKGGLHGNAAFI